MHSSGSYAPGGETVLIGHGVHEVGSIEYVPLGQFLHARGVLAPISVENIPCLQLSHIISSISYVPEGQSALVLCTTPPSAIAMNMTIISSIMRALTWCKFVCIHVLRREKRLVLACGSLCTLASSLQNEYRGKLV